MSEQFKVILEMIDEIFTKKMHFMQQFSSSVELFNEKEVILKFEMSEKLVGNPLSKILHGGAIASMLDSVGGMVAMSAVSVKHTKCNPQEFVERLGRTSTVNLLINYLSPGRGDTNEHFYAVANVVKCGRRITVCELALKDKNKKILATGTGTYMNGE